MNNTTQIEYTHKLGDLNTWCTLVVPTNQLNSTIDDLIDQGYVCKINHNT